MNLREVVKQDEEKIIEMYEEYMSSELIPGIDRFEEIRDFEKLEKLSFNDWIDDLEKNKYEKNLPESYSPYTLYLAINDKEGQMVYSVVNTDIVSLINKELVLNDINVYRISEATNTLEKDFFRMIGKSNDKTN